MKGRSIIALAAVVLLLAGMAGCGGERGKGTNRNKDVPTPATTK